MKIVLSISLIIATTLCGCSDNSLSNTKNNINQSIQNNIKKVTASKTFTRNTQYSKPEQIDTAFDKTDEKKDISKRCMILESEIKKIDGIDNASVAIIGTSALVGLYTINETKDNELIAVKKNIENKIKELDDKITIVAVTTKPELVSRIKNISDKITNEIPTNTSYNLY